MRYLKLNNKYNHSSSRTISPNVYIHISFIIGKKIKGKCEGENRKKAHASSLRESSIGLYEKR